MPNILYIMGSGRSGTTILEILLANNPPLIGVGELKHIFRDGFIRNKHCACGSRARECVLWSVVLETMKYSRADCANIDAILSGIEAHRLFLCVWLGLVRKKDLEIYRSANSNIYRSVAAATNVPIVVDSSKYAARALLLSRLYPENVKVVCITRSAKGLINAFKKKNEGEQREKGLLSVAAYYLYVLFCFKLSKGRLKDRCLTVRFEELANDPVKLLYKIEQWSGYPLGEAVDKLTFDRRFDVGHIVTGNRLRAEQEVKFKSVKNNSVEATLIERLIGNFLEGYRRLLGF